MKRYAQLPAPGEGFSLVMRGQPLTKTLSLVLIGSHEHALTRSELTRLRDMLNDMLTDMGDA